jgi:hypothetical protein
MNIEWKKITDGIGDAVAHGIRNGNIVYTVHQKELPPGGYPSGTVYWLHNEETLMGEGQFFMTVDEAMAAAR